MNADEWALIVRRPNSEPWRLAVYCFGRYAGTAEGATRRARRLWAVKAGRTRMMADILGTRTGAVPMGYWLRFGAKVL
jgi:hypothetical protein